MTAAYETYRRDGLLPASYEIIYGHCWVPGDGQAKPRGDTVAVPIERIQGRRRRP